MRKYQPIWNQIRDNRTATLLAPAEAHDKIILAVRKEKVRDLGYKLLLLEEGKRENLTVETDSNLGTITFGLTDASSVLLSTL